MKKYKLLMLTTLIISGCSICYELIISAVSSYLVGDTVLQYSVTIGLYLCAMGIGSFLSKFMKKDLFNWFVMIETGVGLLGGSCALLLFYANLYLDTYQLVMYTEIILIGTLVGAEIPVLTRIIEQDNENLRVTLSAIFSFDYIGGLVGSIAFPLVLLPHLGYFATSFLTGSMNLVAASIIVFKYRERIKNSGFHIVVTVAILAGMIFGMLFSENIANHVEGGLYRDRVILSQHTQYQHVVMTKHKDDLRLFIDGNIQFCSNDEYRYHEALVHVPMSAVKKHDEVLILGGGDGLAARELLKYEGTRVTLVDLDPQMTELCSTNYDIVKLNGGSLTDERVRVINDDAYRYLQEPDRIYDVIIVDLPDPNNETLNKLYTNIFYRMCGNALSDDGIMAVQSTSPYYAPKAFWCINKTLDSEGFYTAAYHLQVPAFGDWGFNLASRYEISLEDTELSVETRFLSDENLPSLFVFGKDEKTAENEIEINSLSKPMLISYYSEAVRNWE